MPCSWLQLLHAAQITYRRPGLFDGLAAMHNPRCRPGSEGGLQRIAEHPSLSACIQPVRTSHNTCGLGLLVEPCVLCLLLARLLIAELVDLLIVLHLFLCALPV